MEDNPTSGLKAVHEWGYSTSDSVKKLLLIIVLFLPVLAWGQRATISARVTDAETGESLGFASVGIKSQPIGTISNADGEFDFHFPISLRDDTLVISMMGYENFYARLRDVMHSRDTTFTLRKSTVELQEIVVADTLSGGDILRAALAKIDENYPTQPFLLDAFYRDVKKVAGTYISLLEAAVNIYDENYQEPRNKHKLREKVSLLEVRKSIGYESKFTAYFDQANLLEDLLLENTIRYRHIEPDDEFLSTIDREDNSTYDGHEIYVIQTTKDVNLKLYIDKEDFAIIHLEYQTGLGSLDVQKKKHLISKFMGSRKSIDFRRYNGKMYPSFMTMTSSINWYDVRTGALKFETELIQQLLINKVSANVDEKKVDMSGAKMKNYGLQYQDQPYNKEFWDNYNVIKDTPLDQKILKDLEKIAPLEAQFADY